MTNELLIALISAFVAALVTLSSVYLTNRNNYKNLRLRLLSENSFKIFETHQKIRPGSDSFVFIHILSTM